ncbi:chaperone protein DnaK [Actinoplanes lobatus]|uniref:Chaperone protein DnaK n=1 Tax=Actinoplanes lobatus TaxID=113568 RepID=A0A7W7MLX3_9ACTN|nr:Hsp70 family protein [Actinoplanes lobatus]MBB4755013.1 molecular chaperone DnaK (HSP70) [Actinoplanes lobatus]GGN82522.1 chaperone protein DnaK [Actinoplanes lobatus]GIE40668.1 chaperone protein DnaK [Actinoplanes lobatus]
MSDAFGIDFGTTNSVLARTTANGVEAVPLDPGLPLEWANLEFDRVLPSVIGFEGGDPVFGWAAKRQRTGKLEAVKRLFATEDSVTIGDQDLKVEVAAAMFFRHIQQQAAAAGIIAKLNRAVVTIPANSRGLARFRTKLSAGLAGMEVLALINEPTAAAMAYAHAIGQNQRILVFDWGGGTLDVTVLQAFDGVFIEQASKGVQRLGGLDIDDAFRAAVLPQIPGSADWDDEKQGLFRLDLERAKIELSQQDTTRIPLPGGGYHQVSRALLEESVAALVQRTREPVDICLRDSPGRIDHLVMVGGSSNMPVIRRFVSDIVGVEPSTGVNPMLAVAQGAAIASGILQGTVTDLDFHVGTEHALGIVVHNDSSPPEGSFSVLIRRNTKYPARATDSYVPAMDFQEQVNVQVIEGDPDKPIGHEDNVVLKDWDIDLPEQRLRTDASFTVTYEYDLDGILHVLVRDQRTGNVLSETEVAVGAAEDRTQLPLMRRNVDSLMTVGATPKPRISAEAQAVVRKARDKVLPFVADDDRDTLEKLVTDLEAAAPETEKDRTEALEAELRNHAYLLW